MIHTDGRPTICNPAVDQALNEHGSRHVDGVGAQDEGLAQEALRAMGVIGADPRDAFADMLAGASVTRSDIEKHAGVIEQALIWYADDLRECRAEEEKHAPGTTDDYRRALDSIAQAEQWLKSL